MGDSGKGRKGGLDGRRAKSEEEARKQALKYVLGRR